MNDNRNSNNKLNTSSDTMNSKSDRKKASPVEKESIKEIEKKTIKASVNTLSIAMELIKKYECGN